MYEVCFNIKFKKERGSVLVKGYDRNKEGYLGLGNGNF